MTTFRDWLKSIVKNNPRFIADNNVFDWQFVNWYFHHFLESNPFGFSSTNLGSLYKGVKRTVYENFKHLRTGKHTHHPVDDARGNVGALIKIVDQYNLKLPIGKYTK